MFYDAMLAGGVEPKKANLMYLAVYYGGPRWSRATIHNNRIAIGSCRACASVGGAVNNDSFALKVGEKLSANRTIVFEHDKPVLSKQNAEAMAAREAAISTAPTISKRRGGA